MRFLRRRLRLIGPLLAVMVLAGGVATLQTAGDPDMAAASDTAVPQQALDEHYLNCFDLPEIVPDLPGAARLEGDQEMNQNIMNCFAWQEFIALNWQASANHAGQPDMSIPASLFGEPGANAPVVWETYKEDYEVFLPNAATPDPWGADQSIPSICQDVAVEGARQLPAVAKFSNSVQVLDEFGQANSAVSDPDAWLTAQSGHRAHYEVRMNEVEFDYIIEHEFYNALKQYEAVQQAIAEGGPGIYFPKGTPDTAGAIEIKAAWIELDNPGLANRYLTTQAYIYNEQQEDPDCYVATVGLIGLHIIQKSTDQWTWATFEHIQNAPSIAEIARQELQDVYRFWSPNCKVNCAPNRKPEAGQPYDQPIQVVRIKDIADVGSWGNFEDNVASLNSYMQQQIREANPDSVFQHYELVSIGWPVDPVANDHVTTGPLPYQNIVPESLANSIMETYFQQHHVNCSDCHSVAHIAPSSAEANPQWRSDYSFLLSRADEPSSGEE
ncbi:hypothetical protein BH23CHL2_BH23CHL2_11040 [soil metagenome]